MREVSLREALEHREHGETIIYRDILERDVFNLVFPKDKYLNSLPSTNEDSFTWYVRDMN